MDWTRLAGTLVPPLCAGCGGQCDAARVICPECLWRLDASGPVFGETPNGIDRITSVTDHEGVGRNLLAAYKFRGLIGLGEFLAARMADVTPGHLTGPRVIVAVPAAKLRRRWRGFDPAADLAGRLAEHLEWPSDLDSMGRSGSGRQRGRGRAGRIGDPPRIETLGSSPSDVLLVDDVITTGATLAACAATLRKAGSRRIDAVTFTRRA